MTVEEKQHLRANLAEQVKNLEVDIERMNEATEPIGYDVSVGRLSRMEALGEKGVREANLRSLEDKLSKLRTTLKIIDDDNFGICQKCKQPIPLARVMAVPESSFCVNCA